MALSPGMGTCWDDQLYANNYVDNKTVPIEKHATFYDPQSPGKSIAQAILDGQAYVDSITIRNDCGDFILPEICVEMSVRLCGEVTYVDATDHPTSEIKIPESPPFEKKPPKPGLKRKIVIKAYNNK